MTQNVSKTMIIRLLLTLVLLILGPFASLGASSPDADSDGDGIPDRIERLIGSQPGRAQTWTVFWSRDAKAPAKPGPQLLQAAVAHVAEDRFVWKIDWTEPFPGDGSLIVYVDGDRSPKTGRQDSSSTTGTDMMYVISGPRCSVSYHGSFAKLQHAPLRTEMFGNSIVICHDAPLNKEDGAAVVRVRLLAEGSVRGSSSWTEVRIPLSGKGSKPRLPGPEDLDFQGISGDAVRRSMSGPYPERRPQPPVPYVSSALRKQAAIVARERVQIDLAEEEGIARRATPVRFGFPLPQGALFDPSQARLLAPNGREVPAQFTTTGFWKDDSIRWMAVAFIADVAAKTNAQYSVEFGSRVKRKPVARRLRLSRDGDLVFVDTGAMRVQFNAKQFGFFDRVCVGGEPLAHSEKGGLILTTHDGKRFTSAAGETSFRIEESGPLTIGVRLEGPLCDEKGGKFMRHVTRLRFYAGSTKVDLACTLIDDALEHEFADFRSVELPLVMDRKVETARFALPDAEIEESVAELPARLFQRDDQSFDLNGSQLRNGKRAAGRVAVGGKDGRELAIAVEEFWQNYPCALRVTRDDLNVELWPNISESADYAKLPEHLHFCFVGGGYRFKWGMARTRRLSLDFAADKAAPIAPAEPLVAVVPSAWYERTGALGPMVARRGDELATWDAVMDQSFLDHLRQKESKREYGFFNWGDWHGERESNWGNNEYDLPHALFMQFARTGDRRYYRLALAGARHQADVDCVHAYPDPAFVGANILHSIGHTGEWSEHLSKRGWSFAYAYHGMACNGHTWAEGLCDAWYLGGDETSMEAAQGLGEHVVYGMVPRFKALGTHERSAGWSLIATIAIYRATRDPLYLEAARQIAGVAFRERKPGQGSGWPHTLPGDHCGHSHIPGAKLCVGNACFLIGILCSGLKEYYLESGDVRAREAILGTADWWKQLWDKDAAGLPYTSCSLFRATPGSLTTMLCADAFAYIGREKPDVAMIDMAAESVMSNLLSPPGGFGKNFAQLSRSAQPILAAVRDAAGQSEAARRLLSANSEDLLAAKLAKGKPVEFIGIRGPKEKRFLVKVADGGETVRIVRKQHGSMTKGDARGMVVVSDPQGCEVKRTTFDTDDPYELTLKIPAGSPGIYQVRINDDMRGIWHVSSDDGHVVLDCSKQPALANYRFSRLYFRVPEGVRQFRVKISAGHRGGYGMGIFDGAGRLRGMAYGARSGNLSSDATRQIDVSVPEGKDGTIWSMVAFAGMDWDLKMENIPPYVSTSAAGWFGER